MKKFINIKLVRSALGLCVALVLAFSVALCCSAASLNVIRFNRRNAVTEDVPPIGEGLESAIDGIGTDAENAIDGIESGAEDIIDGIESGAGDVMDGAESFFDGAESDMGGVTDGTDGFETNIPDPDIGGAVVDDDNDGISNPTDSDDDNDGTPDASDTDADNDGIADKNDPDPDGDGVKESKMSGLVIGIIITVLVVGAIAILAYAFMPKKDSGNKR